MKDSNQKAPVKCSKAIIINASCAKVWEILTNINNWANWQTDISKSLMNNELKTNQSFYWHTGGAKIYSTLHTVEPYKRFGWTGRTFGLFAIHNWTLTEADGQTTVWVDESMEGFLANLMKKTFNRSLEKGMKTWLELLKKESER